MINTTKFRSADTPLVVIVDCAVGNMFSVTRAIQHAGLRSMVSHSAADVEKADAIVLPGVGAFARAMDALRRNDLIQPLVDYAASGRPLVGICLGMQLLLSESHEFGLHRGLGLIAGSVVRLPSDGRPVEGLPRLKVPLIGWNPIRETRSWQGTLLEGLPAGCFTYFVHSYYAVPDDGDVTLATASFGSLDYCAALKRDNIEAFQFHPERSGRHGQTIFRNLARRLGLELSNRPADEVMA